MATRDAINILSNPDYGPKRKSAIYIHDASQDMPPHNNTPLIGILGGMGPTAGLDLASKIILETCANLDQQHLPTVHLSIPENIPNRTDFLLGKTDVNPGIEIARQLKILDTVGVTVAAISCNTAHATPIFDEILRRLRQSELRIQLLHLIDETIRYVIENFPDLRNVGILGTMGTYRFRIYDDPLKAAGLIPVLPDKQIATEVLQDSIFNPIWGIKAVSNPITDRARELVHDSVQHLLGKGAEAVILGCTELPLAIDGPLQADSIVIDPTHVLARSLIRNSFPEKLRPVESLGSTTS